MSGRKKAGLWMGIALLLAVPAIAIASWLGLIDSWWPGSKMELTGTVLDAASKEPVQGAYVVALYISFHGHRPYCRAVRSAITGADGKFRFPVEKTDGFNPRVHAVLADHYTKFEVFPGGPDFKPREAAFYRDRDIYLARQDKDYPARLYLSGEDCWPEFETSEGGVAYGEFLARADAEESKYFPAPRR